MRAFFVYMGEKLKPNFSEVPRLQMEVIGQLGGLWEKNQEAIDWFKEKTEQLWVVVTGRCADARDVKNIGSGLKNKELPAIDSIKSVAGYPRPDREELNDLILRARMFEVTSHHDPEGKISNVGEEKGSSKCGGEGAKFGFYQNEEYLKLVAEDGGKGIDRKINKLLKKYQKDLVEIHGLPEETAETVTVDLCWARSRGVAEKYWRDYVGEGEWQDELVSAILGNIDQFRDEENLGLDAWVRAYAYTQMINEAGVISNETPARWVSAALVNHRLQASVPMSLFRISDQKVEAFFPDSVEHQGVGDLIGSWQEKMIVGGELQTVAVDKFPNRIPEVYYRYASQVVIGQEQREKTASQGGFYLGIDAGELMGALVYAGGILKHEKSFWVRLLGKDKQQLSYRDKRVLQHLGYGEHLQGEDKGLVVFADSTKEAQVILDEVFVKGWGKKYKNKDKVTVMVVDEVGGKWQGKFYGTKITASEVKLIEVAR